MTTLPRWKYKLIAQHFKIDLDSSIENADNGDSFLTIEVRNFHEAPIYNLIDFPFLYDELGIEDNEGTTDDLIEFDYQDNGTTKETCNYDLCKVLLEDLLEGVLTDELVDNGNKILPDLECYKFTGKNIQQKRNSELHLNMSKNVQLSKQTNSLRLSIRDTRKRRDKTRSLIDMKRLELKNINSCISKLEKSSEAKEKVIKGIAEARERQQKARTQKVTKEMELKNIKSKIWNIDSISEIKKSAVEDIKHEIKLASQLHKSMKLIEKPKNVTIQEIKNKSKKLNFQLNKIKQRQDRIRSQVVVKEVELKNVKLQIVKLDQISETKKYEIEDIEQDMSIVSLKQTCTMETKNENLTEAFIEDKNFINLNSLNLKLAKQEETVFNAIQHKIELAIQEKLEQPVDEKTMNIESMEYNSAINLRLALQVSIKKRIKVTAQVKDSKTRLKNCKDKILEKERLIKSKQKEIKELKQEISIASMPSLLKFIDILGLKFKEENEDSSNYPLCLRSFLQTGVLEKVEEVDGEIVLKFKSSDDLVKLLTSKCIKTVQWTKLSKLPQRAALVPRMQFQDFNLLVYLEETSLLNKSITQVEQELVSSGARVETRSFGFIARFPNLLTFLKCLVNTELNLHHRLQFSNDNILFLGTRGDVKFFNSKVCLLEEDLLRLRWKSEDCFGRGFPSQEFSGDGLSSEQHSGDGLSKSRFVTGLSSFLRNAAVEEVMLDWNSRIVVIFHSQDHLEKLLQQHCSTKSNSPSMLAKLPVRFSFISTSSFYFVKCGQEVDVRVFFLLDSNATMSECQGEISSKSRTFPFLCLTDPQLRANYTDISFKNSNFIFT